MSTVLAPAHPSRRGPAGPHPYGAAAPQLDPRRAPRRGPAPEPARRDHLRVVQPGERTMRRLTPLGGVALTALLFVVLAALAGAHTFIAQGQIRLDDLDQRVAEEQARYQQLRKDVAQAESPERIVTAAEAQGMVMPDDLQYLQPPTDDGVRSAGERSASESAAARANGDWSDVKPLLEVPAP